MSYTGSCVAIDSCEVTCWTWPLGPLMISLTNSPNQHIESLHESPCFDHFFVCKKNICLLWCISFHSKQPALIQLILYTQQKQPLKTKSFPCTHPSHDHLRVGTIHPRRSFSRITTKLPLLQLWVISKFWATENPAISDQTKLFCSGNSTMMNQQSAMLWPFRFCPGCLSAPALLQTKSTRNFGVFASFGVVIFAFASDFLWFFHILNPGTSWSWVHGRW